jgi:hypothetical protein
MSHFSELCSALTLDQPVKARCQFSHPGEFQRTPKDLDIRQGRVCWVLNGSSPLSGNLHFMTVAQLNLKNDTLRRRYDSLKYDLKKIEEGTLWSLPISCAIFSD